MLEEERRRREEAERRLQDETAHRQRLVEEEVKMRERHFSQVSGTAGGDRRREEALEGREGGGDGRLGGEDMGETLKGGWAYGKIKDCRRRGENGEESRECERKNRDKTDGGAQACTHN